jgi:hypothetical protein
MTYRENVLRAIRFETPEYIPMTFHINAACWHSYPQDALQELMASHPLLFPGFTPSEAPVVPDLFRIGIAVFRFLNLFHCPLMGRLSPHSAPTGRSQTDPPTALAFLANTNMVMGSFRLHGA